MLVQLEEAEAAVPVDVVVTDIVVVLVVRIGFGEGSMLLWLKKFKTEERV